MSRIRLGLNVDHVATVRNARGGRAPDPERAARLALQAGVDGITAHLREDRRHILDRDIAALKTVCDAYHKPLNFEMAVTDEMIGIALDLKPHAACLVPERRQERTTEGGLDVAGRIETVGTAVAKFNAAGIRASLFIAADPEQVAAAARIEAPVVEFHTGEYAHTEGEQVAVELKRIADMAALAAKNGIEPHAGHGLTYANVQPIAAIPQIMELNIGHYLIGEAIFVGLEGAVRRMRELMDAAR